MEETKETKRFLAAAKAGKLDVVQKMVENGFNIDEQDEVMETALYVSVTGDQVHVVSYLAKQGADVNIVNNLGFSPLHEAAQYGYYSCAEILLHNGAHTHIRNHTKHRPLDLARKRNHKKMCKLILRNSYTK